MSFSKKKHNVSKEHKKGSSLSPSSGTYTQKPNSNCKNCPHRALKSLTPSLSNSSNSSSTGLVSRLPKQKSTKKLHKIL